MPEPAARNLFLVAGLVLVARVLAASDGPRLLPDPATPEGAKAVQPTSAQVTPTLADDGLSVRIAGGPDGYPGVVIRPGVEDGWDLSAFGHIEASISNRGTNRLTVVLQAESEGDWRTRPWSADKFPLKPGETRTVTLYLGYDFGTKSAAFKPDAVRGIRLYTGKTATEASFHVSRLTAGGPAGERPAVDPGRAAVKPPRGVLFDGAMRIDSVRQLRARGGARAALTADGKAIDVIFTGGANEAVSLRPAEGFWNLSDGVEVRVALRNTGADVARPSLRLESRRDGQTECGDEVTASLAPGAETEVVIPFAARTPWRGVVDKAQEAAALQEKPPRVWGGVPGTGTRFRSNQAEALTILAGTNAGPQRLLIARVVCGVPPLAPPAWLGRRPPVPGDWTRTFADEFDGRTVDLTKWNTCMANNYWDKRTHFSTNNAIVSNGRLALRVERRRGRQNDAPDGPETDYATGVATTYGKWTQRYGYFEARMKVPTAPNMFYAFWLMPDRGLAAGPEEWKRAGTSNGGMEFDIMEGLSVWGPHRHDFGCHWDDYGKKHQSIGGDGFYCQADDEGFMVVGMLWEPGRIVLFDNGVEAARWESPRIASVQAHIILDHVTGGWETEGMDDARLPADLVFDWVRVWQRRDLASPEDGPKPNNGGPWPPTAAHGAAAEATLTDGRVVLSPAKE